MEGGLGKKEQESYGKVLSSHCFRAHKQLHDFIVVAPGHQDVEFLPAHGSRTEKWQAHCDPACHFCSGSETLPDRHVWGRELGAQPPSGERRSHLVRGRHREKIHAIELSQDAAALVFREALRSGPPGVPAVIFREYREREVLPYLGVTENASLEEFEREVLTHPVFLVQSASEQAGAESP